MSHAEHDFDQVHTDELTTIGVPPQQSYDPLCDVELDEAWYASDLTEDLHDIANGTAYIPDADLPMGTQLYWRVTASNQCGPGAPSAR